MTWAFNKIKSSLKLSLSLFQASILHHHHKAIMQPSWHSALLPFGCIHTANTVETNIHISVKVLIVSINIHISIKVLIVSINRSFIFHLLTLSDLVCPLYVLLHEHAMLHSIVYTCGHLGFCQSFVVTKTGHSKIWKHTYNSLSLSLPLCWLNKHLKKKKNPSRISSSSSTWMCYLACSHLTPEYLAWIQALPLITVSWGYGSNSCHSYERSGVSFV